MMIIMMMMIACFREPQEVNCSSLEQESKGADITEDIGGSGSLGSWTDPFTGGSGDYEFRWPYRPPVKEVPFDPDQMEEDKGQDTASTAPPKEEEQKCYR
jgi:hypothetical protein